MTTAQKELPVGWKWVKLGDVCEFVNGKTFRITDWSTTGYPIIRIQNLNNPDAVFNYWDGSLEKQVIVQPQELLLAWSGTPGTSFGAHIWNGNKSVLNQHIFRVGVDEKYIQKQFALIAINFHLNILIDAAHGTAGLQHVTKKEVQNLFLPLPPLEEQNRIAGILNKAEAIKKLREEANKKTEKLIPAIFHEIGGSRIEKGEALPIGWKWVKLGDVSKITARLVDPTADEYADLPHVNGENITSGSGQLYGIKTVSELGMISGKYLFNPGDVLYSKIRPYLKKAATVNFAGLCSADMYPIVANPNQLDSYWLWALLLSDGFTHYANKESARSRMPKLNRTQLMSWEFPLPPIDEQKQIANRLNEADEIKKTNAESNKKIEELRSSLLQRAFRGEL